MIAPWRDWPLARKGMLAVAVPVALLAGALASLVLIERATAAAEAEARRTLTVQANILSVHAQLAEAATGVRGYLLTGREDFLLRYREAQGSLPETLARLQATVRDPEQTARLARVMPLARQKLDGLEALREQGRFLPEPELIARIVSQKKVLDELRSEIDALRVREDTLINESLARARAARQRNLAVITLAGAVGLSAVLLAVWLFAADIIRRVRHLRDEAQRLARAEWLTAEDPSRDELGQLATSLAEASRLLRARAEETQAARLAAERASAAKSAFLSRTSHELRTPLNAIIGFGQMLAESPDAATAGAAHEVVQGGRHLQGLIDELLELGRIEAGSAVGAREETFALASVIAEAVSLAGAPHAAVEVDCPPTLAVRADRRRVRQVLLNLLSNALKYGPPEGPVAVSVTRAGERQRVQVADRGPGIAPELRARLFTPFDRLGQERGSAPGSGLGLAVSERLVQNMGGTLALEDRPGGGSVFWFTLPAGDDRREPPPGPSPAVAAPARTVAPPAPATRHRVLAVEDHPANRLLLQAVLARRSDVELTLATTLAEAREAAVKTRPALVLLDWHLPDGDGAALIPSLRAANPRLPVLVLTADAVPATRAQALAAGADAVLTKPLDIAAFNQLIDQHLS